MRRQLRRQQSKDSSPASSTHVGVRGIVQRHNDEFAVREFKLRRDGMIYAMDGGMWLHHHVWQGRPLAHLISTDRAKLLSVGSRLGLKKEQLQYRPLKDPRTGKRREAWHWDLSGSYLRAIAGLTLNP